MLELKYVAELSYEAYRDCLWVESTGSFELSA